MIALPKGEVIAWYMVRESGRVMAEEFGVLPKVDYLGCMLGCLAGVPLALLAGCVKMQTMHCVSS